MITGDVPSALHRKVFETEGAEDSINHLEPSLSCL